MWICDIGAVFVVDKNGNEAVVDWNFNGWGNRLDCDKDSKVSSIIAKEYSLPIFNPPLVQEGGHEVNGVGDLLVTKSSILNSAQTKCFLTCSFNFYYKLNCISTYVSQRLCQ